MVGSWRSKYDDAAREILKAERFMYRRACLRNGAMPCPSFRQYLEVRAQLMSTAVWEERMAGEMPDMGILYALLVLERYLRLTEHREQKVGRDKWIEENSRIRIASMEAVAPTPRIVAAGWTIERVGSVWYMDEEYHVYVPSAAVGEAAAAVSRGSNESPIVTPMFVFMRQGRAAVGVEDPAVRALAAARLGVMISDSVAGGRTNG